MNRQAVVIIHGVGEQVPMDTLREFVKTVWLTDAQACAPSDLPRAWSKPDETSGDFELRRITTNRNRNGTRTDFFEFYWAHLMRDTTLSAVWAWARLLLLRSPSRVPRALRPVWLSLWLLALVAAAGAALVTWPDAGARLLGWNRATVGVASAVATVLWTALAGFLVYYAGDAARYLHVRPPNIDVRHAIRAAGVDLLQKLHKSGRFDRIVVVGHSLGTVIAYDILGYFWQSCHAQLSLSGPQSTAALRTLERLAQDPTGGYADAQPAYFSELRAQGCPWLVTDLVTLGSPLAHAEVLLARNLKQLDQKRLDRELPTCPPQLENGSEFSFTNNGAVCPHHAALFGPTRWTNLYFPYRGLIFGDPIGGPVAPVFGAGVRDVPLTTTQWGGIFPHTRYWTDTASGNAPHIRALRDAVRIC